MKCKKHSTDLSSNVGVCASCLRERLIAIIAAQVQAQKRAQFNQAQQACRKSDAQQRPPSLAFPRSVSPYISHRKSDSAATWHLHGHHQRFYSTPQVGPTGLITVEIEKNKKSRGVRFSSIFLGLFRWKSYKTGLDTGANSDRRVSVDSCSASPSWFSTMAPSRRKKQIRAFSLDDYAIEAKRKPIQKRDRGMSPARFSEGEDDEHCRGGSSGYSSESSQGWKQTPRRTPATKRGGGKTAAHSNRNMSGLAFCLSPLVRPSPNRNWSQKVFPPEMVVARDWEGRIPPKPHLSAAPSFCKNRSRKLASFGKQGYSPFASH